MAEKTPMHESVGPRGEVIRIRPELTPQALSQKFRDYQRDRQLLLETARSGNMEAGMRALSQFIIRYQIQMAEGNRGFKEYENDLLRNGLVFSQGRDPMGWQYRFYSNIKFIHDQLLPERESRLKLVHGPSLWDRFLDWAVTDGADNAEFKHQKLYATARLAAMRRNLADAIEIMERPGELSNSIRMAYAMGKFADYLHELKEFERSMATMINVFKVTPDIEVWERIRNVVVATAASVATGQFFKSASLLVAVPAQVTVGQFSDYFFSGHVPTARKIMADLTMSSLLGKTSRLFHHTKYADRAEVLLTGSELGKNFYLEFGMDPGH